jgi:hypothetical protein
MYAGGGRHAEEGQALKDRLSGKMSAEEASHSPVARYLSEDVPNDDIYRVWALLSGALVETEEGDHKKMYELIGALQQFPEQGRIDFNRLSGFHIMWDILYRTAYHGPAEWEKSTSLSLLRPSRIFVITTTLLVAQRLRCLLATLGIILLNGDSWHLTSSSRTTPFARRLHRARSRLGGRGRR